MPSALVFMSGSPVFVATTQGMLLDYLALEAGGACIPGFFGTTAIGETILGRLPPSSLSVKKASLLVLELWS